MSVRKPAKQYAVYTGKEKIFPQNQTLHHNEIFEIEVIPKNEGHPVLLKVLAPKWSLYIPYPNIADIWLEWMPYLGRVVG